MASFSIELMIKKPSLSRALSELIEDDVEGIKRAYPQSRVVKWGNGSLGRPKVVFIQELLYQKPVYPGQFDKAKFYAVMMPACFVHADVYQGKDYQYSIATSSGAWQERLAVLKRAVEKVAKEGIAAISDEIKAGDLDKYTERVK